MSRDPLTVALQAYADRGVFRGFSAVAGRGGRVEFEFRWLTKTPMRAVFDPRARALAFPALLPLLPPDAAKDLEAVIRARRGKGVPEHKRIDARRARVAVTRRGGGLGLTIEIRGHNHGYAARQALGLINELFVTLHEHHPGYLIERFGVSAE